MKSLTSWEYSIDTEVERVLHTAHQTYIGFYKNYNFIVLPKNSKGFNSNVVVLPDLNFKVVPKFWKRVSKMDLNGTPMYIDPSLRNDFKSLLIKTKLTKPNFEKVQETWSKAEKDVINAIYEVLPVKKNSIKKIIIYPTKSGTVCSFDWTKKGEFIIYLRDDQGIYKIAEALLTSLTREDVYNKLDGLWHESEIIADFLVTQTKITKVLEKYEKEDKYSTTISGIRVKDVGNLTKLSNEYYNKLSIPNFVSPFSLNGLTPEVNKKPILNLTQNEKQFMYLLIKNSNNIVAFDNISDIIFSSDDKFSLFALAKFIQRLREKLEKNGISGSFIQTIRGKGYLLKN